jgi:hypothetical protein
MKNATDTSNSNILLDTLNTRKENKMREILYKR